MSKSVVITARIDPDTAEGIDRLAKRCNRSRAWLAQQAIERFVKEETEFLAFVQVGIDAADRGDVYSQDAMEEWFAARSRQAAAE